MQIQPALPRRLLLASLLSLTILPASFAIQTSRKDGQVIADDQQSSYAGPLKIAKILWNANPKSAATTLTRSIESALAREQLEELVPALELLRAEATGVFNAGIYESSGSQSPDTVSPDTVSPDTGSKELQDPRFAVASATLLLLQASSERESESELIVEPENLLARLSDLKQRELLSRVWLESDRDGFWLYFASELGKSELDKSAAQATAPEGTEVRQAEEWLKILIQRSIKADADTAAPLVIGHWGKLPGPVQAAAIEPLSSSVAGMQNVLDAIGRGEVDRSLVNMNQLRKWLNAGHPTIENQIAEIWGRIRLDDNQQRQALVAETVALLNSGVSGSVKRGQLVFGRVCSQCHVLHDTGHEVGPAITSNGRGSLEQLVSNVLDPSLVIGEAFQAKTVLTVDGDIVAGLVVEETPKYLTLKVQGGEKVEFSKDDDIEQVKTSSKSLMPEGLEAQMSQQELIDLFAYLCLTRPLGTNDNSLISGTPEQLVTP